MFQAFYENFLGPPQDLNQRVILNSGCFSRIGASVQQRIPPRFYHFCCWQFGPQWMKLHSFDRLPLPSLD